jgi:hypothetical protein
VYVYQTVCRWMCVLVRDHCRGGVHRNEHMSKRALNDVARYMTVRARATEQWVRVKAHEHRKSLTHLVWTSVTTSARSHPCFQPECHGANRSQSVGMSWVAGLPTILPSSGVTTVSTLPGPEQARPEAQRARPNHQSEAEEKQKRKTTMAQQNKGCGWVEQLITCSCVTFCEVHL